MTRLNEAKEFQEKANTLKTPNQPTTHTMNSAVFLRTLKETLFAYSFDFGGLLAGFVLASQLNVFQLSPWAIAIYPAIVSAKGVIGGLLSGRLSTALHVGTVYPRFFGNTRSFYMLYAALTVITLATSVAMSLVSLVFGLLFWGITIADFLAILRAVVATMALGLFLTLITVKVAFVTFQKGLDPDVVVYPIMSTTADIFITLCYVLVLNLTYLFDFGQHVVSLIALLHVVLIIYILPRNIHDEEFLKTIRESLLTTLLVAFIVNITGTVLKRISIVIEERKEIYTVYPALIDMVGDVGSVIGSTATTRLALGLLRPSISAMKSHAMQILSAWTASVIMFVLLAVSSLIINGIFTLYTFLGLASVLLVTNLIAVAATILVSFIVSIITFERGLDPDNFVIPIESSLADSMTSIALLVGLILVE
nr:magnesium transporter [Candidatus Njordarchaeum guaymaensis]